MNKDFVNEKDVVSITNFLILFVTAFSGVWFIGLIAVFVVQIWYNQILKAREEKKKQEEEAARLAENIRIVSEVQNV